MLQGESKGMGWPGSSGLPYLQGPTMCIKAQGSLCCSSAGLQH